jgi:hypothetical protein
MRGEKEEWETALGLELFARGFATLLLHSRVSLFWYSGAHSRARLGQLIPRALLTSVFQFFMQVEFPFGLIYPFECSCARVAAGLRVFFLPPENRTCAVVCHQGTRYQVVAQPATTICP